MYKTHTLLNECISYINPLFFILREILNPQLFAGFSIHCIGLKHPLGIDSKLRGTIHCRCSLFIFFWPFYSFILNICLLCSILPRYRLSLMNYRVNFVLLLVEFMEINSEFCCHGNGFKMDFYCIVVMVY